ncbi:MAG: helix-turn-helix domain-containing protein [Acidobacteria bacterium]|nr:helix-turn-helix domain-containing protein [Acidobacteriota bacterium]
MSAKSLLFAPPADSAQDVEDNVFDNGHLRVEHSNYYVACRGIPLKLPRTEFLIMSRLARSPERVVPSEELWHHAWAGHKPFNPVSLHVYMYRLRRKLEPHGLRIDTMVNVGYRLLLAAPNGETRP